MAKGKKAAVLEVEEELDDLEELGDEDEAPARNKKSKKSAVVGKKTAKATDDDETPTYGAAWLAEYVNEACDTEYTATNMRVLLRKMARDGELDRAVGEDRSRYVFTGPNDPIVKAVIKHVRAGTLEKERQDRLDAVKAKKDAKATKAAATDDEDEDEAPVVKTKKATRKRAS